MIESDMQNTSSNAAASQDESAAAPGTTAGQLLRAAREQAGMRLPALAANLKVAPNKLEALEADDWSVFPDVVFIRALASAICRVLKVDAAPILALLPQAPGRDLSKVGEGINAKVSGGMAPSKGGDFSSSKAFPWMGVVALLVVATAGVLFYPQLSERWQKQSVAAPATTSARANTIASDASSSEPVALGTASDNVETPANPAAPAAPGSTTATAAVAAAAAGTAANALATPAAPAAESPLLKVKATQDSWVQVKEASGSVVFEKTIKAGSEQEITATPPLKVVVGNAGGVELLLRGAAFDLKKVTKGSTARFEVN